MRRLEPDGVAIAAWVAGFAALLTAVWALFTSAVGGVAGPGPLGFPWWGPASWTEALFRGLVLGYTPALTAWARRGARRDVAALAKAGLPTPEGVDGLARSILAVPQGWMRAAGVVGLVVLPALGWLAPLLAGREAGYDTTSAQRVFSTLYFMAGGWTIGRALLHDVSVSRTFSRLGASPALPFDLLDASAFRPLTRYGLRTVLLWVGWFALLSLFWIGPEAANPANAFAIVPLLVIATVAFVLPVWGAHVRLRDARRAELARADEALRGARDGLYAPGPSDARVANLVAWRTRVEAVREWPFDAPTVLRFLAFLALGVGSWLGGAVVDRILDVWMAAG